MRDFANLYKSLDETNKTNEKVAAMRDFFREAAPEDAAWALYFLTGRRPKRPVNTTKLQMWAAAAANIPPWLFYECYEATGDLAEAITKVLPDEGGSNDAPLSVWMSDRFFPLAGLSEDEQKRSILGAWAELDAGERFVFNKLITGSFRVGVSQDLVVRAVSQASGIPPAVIAHRLTGSWYPDEQFFTQLLHIDEADADASKPYPFCLAHPLEAPLETLGQPSEWLIEWKWDGIRAQVIRRESQVFIWSRGEDLITGRFPEIALAAQNLPEGTVLDGEVMAWIAGRPLPFLELQKRIGRKTIGKKLLADVPVVLVAYDLLELDSHDWREHALVERRAALEELVGAEHQDSKTIKLSLEVPGETWEELRETRKQSRSLNVEGFMLKRWDSPYLAGRKRGSWWKWKIDPLTVDAVLIYAQRGSGKRASLYTDYTFGVWDGGQLVPFAKAYSGLTDQEIAKVARGQAGGRGGHLGER